MSLVLLFMLGLCFGSFLSAAASRTSDKISRWRGRSFCLSCGRKLRALELVPILNFIFLKGKCSTCRKPIGWREPLTELATGFTFLIIGLIHEGIISPLLIRDLMVTIFLILLFLTDLYHGILPHRFTCAATIAAIGLNLWTKDYSPLQWIWGMVVCGGFFYLQYLISRGRWIGGGDIGLGIFIGAALGLWHGLWALALAYVWGALAAAVLLATKKITLKSTISLGPFLAAAGWIVLLITRI